MKYKSTQLLFQLAVVIGCERTVELDSMGSRYVSTRLGVRLQ